MDLRELRSLITLAEAGSLTRTAGRVNLSAAAIHRQLRVLEEELGVRLYERVGRQLRLTPAAETLLPLARELIAQYEAILAAARDLKGLKRGRLRIGTGPTFSSYILPPLLEEFREHYPDVELLVETGHTKQLTEELQNGLIDLMFLVYPEASARPEFTVEATWDFEVVLVSGLRQPPPRRCRLADLQEQSFILYKKESIFDRIIAGYFAAHDFRPRVSMRLDNAEPIKGMLRSGFGLSMLPLWTVDAELKNKTLLLIRQREPALLVQLALVTRRLNYQPQAVSAFIEMARSWRWQNTRLKSR